MIRVALRPRMLGLLGLVLLAAILCTLLSQWQWSRAQPHNLTPNRAAAAVELATILQPGAPFTNAIQGRPVNVTGTYDAGKELLVAGRNFKGTDGFIVLTPLRVAQSGAYVPVARGWVPERNGVPTGPIPAPPVGIQKLSGLMVVSEGGDNELLPEGQISAVSTAQLLNEWGGTIYSGYLVSATAPQGLNVMPQPSLSEDSGLNLENISYAIQWLVFGCFGLFIYVRQVRDVYTTEQETAEAAAEAELELVRRSTQLDDPSTSAHSERE